MKIGTGTRAVACAARLCSVMITAICRITAPVVDLRLITAFTLPPDFLVRRFIVELSVRLDKEQKG